MVAEVFAGISAFKTMFDIAKAMKDMDDAVKRNAAVFDLGEQTGLTPMALEPILALTSMRELEQGFMPTVVAICTYAMRGFSVCGLWLQGKSKRSTSIVGQLVPLLLCFPCFKLGQLFFKFAYLLNCRRIARLGGDDHRDGRHGL